MGQIPTGPRFSLGLSGLLLLALAGPATLSGQNRAESARPTDLPTLHRQAARQLEERHFEMAETLFDRLTRADPDDGRLWLGLGQALSGLGRLFPAIEAYRRALALGFGSRPERSYDIARLYARAARRDSALAWLRRALDARFERRPSIAQS